jgi:peptidyl-prolyl cis-trans isomerase C
MKKFLKENAPVMPAKDLDAQMGKLIAGLQAQNKTLAEFCRELNKTEAQVRDDVAAVFQWRAYGLKHVSDQQVEKYYHDNKDLFDQVMVRASEILLRVPAQCSESEKAQVKGRLAELRSKILSKDIDFAKAAKQFSQGPTRDLGGDLNWFVHASGILPESVIQAAFSMQPEQISEVIESEYGMHLIKVTGRKPGKPSDFAKIKEEVRQLCIEELQQGILTQLRKSAQVKIEEP